MIWVQNHQGSRMWDTCSLGRQIAKFLGWWTRKLSCLDWFLLLSEKRDFTSIDLNQLDCLKGKKKKSAVTLPNKQNSWTLQECLLGSEKLMLFFLLFYFLYLRKISLFSRLREIEERLQGLKASTISKTPVLKFKVCMSRFLLNILLAIKVHFSYSTFFFFPCP